MSLVILELLATEFHTTFLGAALIVATIFLALVALYKIPALLIRRAKNKRQSSAASALIPTSPTHPSADSPITTAPIISPSKSPGLSQDTDQTDKTLVFDTVEDLERFCSTLQLLESFQTEVKGVTYDNDDGTSRQDILSNCLQGEIVEIHQTWYKGDPAFSVVSRFGIIGFLPARIAKDLYDKYYADDSDCIITYASIRSITGGMDGLSYRCNIRVEIYYNPNLITNDSPVSSLDTRESEISTPNTFQEEVPNTPEILSIANRQCATIERLLIDTEFPVPPDGYEFDPYGELYEIYPEQHGSLDYYPADADIILFTPDYIVFDIETTGLYDYKDQIIEIGAIRVRNGQIVERFHSMVNPGCEIPRDITQLTGIASLDVSYAPDIKTVIREFARFIRETVPVVGHNVTFDLSFLQYAYYQCDIDANLKYIDTLQLARDAWPDLDNHKLNTLIQQFNLMPHGQTHRALDDVIATDRLYNLARRTIQSQLLSDPKIAQKYAKPGILTPLREPKSYYLTRRGKQCEQSNHVEEAIDYYSRALDLDPYQLRAAERIAILYRKEKRYEEEIAVCQAVIDAAKKQNNQFAIEKFQHRIEYTEKRIAARDTHKKKND